MFRQIVEAKVNDIHLKYNEKSGLKAVIAIHSTLRGPSLGGCRIIPYGRTEDAITDVIRLAQGMSYKAALAGLSLGGGKAVIMEPEYNYSREKLFKDFGRFVEELNGRYITAMDSGTSVIDMDNIASETKYVTCTSSVGNPGSYTAKGVFLGIKACIESCSGLNKNLSGMRIAIQGLGNVGSSLCELLRAEGAVLLVSDIDKNKINKCIEQFGATGIDPEDIYKTPCDIFSPCGLGGIIHEKSINELKCKAVAGSANNQLLTPEAGQLLLQKGILYAPDYLINAGGLIFVAMKYLGGGSQELDKRIDGIYYTLLNIFKEEQASGKSSNIIADQMAEAILFKKKKS